MYDEFSSFLFFTEAAQDRGDSAAKVTHSAPSAFSSWALLESGSSAAPLDLLNLQRHGLRRSPSSSSSRRLLHH